MDAERREAGSGDSIMPNPWDVVEERPHGEWDVVEEKPSESWSFGGAADVMAGQAGRALGAAWENINPIPLFQAIRHPFDTASGAFKATSANIGATKKALKKGEYGKAVTSGISALPFVGPPVGAIAENLRQGEIPEAIGHTAGLLAPYAAARALPRGIGPIVKDINNPVERAAISSAERAGIPMTAGQRTGSHGLQKVESGMQNLPGSANRATEFYKTQQAAIGQEGERLARLPSPISTDAYGAAQAVQQKLQSHITNLKSQADVAYDSVRQSAAANTKTLQIGTKPMLNAAGQPIVDAAGNPLPGTPIMQTFESPVDLKPLQAQLRPIYQDLQRSMPVARQEASPAFSTLRDIMTRKMNPPIGETSERYMNAMDFDKALGAIKSITRDGSSPFLTSQSQGIAKQIVKNGEYELQDALKGAPGATPDLATGRKLVRSYYDTADLLGDLHSEPGALYSNLVSGGDRVFDTLQKLNKIAPAELKTVGRTFLEGMVDKATREGGFGRSAGILADWNRLGQRTKDLMYGATLSKDIDNFLLAAKRLTAEANPSGTAHLQTALGAAGAIGGSLVGTLFGHMTAGAAAGVMGTEVVGPALAARVMFSPGGAKLLTKAITLPVNSTGFKAAVHALNLRLLSQPESSLPAPAEITPPRTSPE